MRSPSIARLLALSFLVTAPLSCGSDSNSTGQTQPAGTEAPTESTPSGDDGSTLPAGPGEGSGATAAATNTTGAPSAVGPTETSNTGGSADTRVTAQAGGTTGTTGGATSAGPGAIAETDGSTATDTGTGGAVATGGSAETGGAVATGGSAETDGAVGTGGAAESGGGTTADTGGAVATGGTAETGGATAETGGTAAETGGTAGSGATATDTYAIIIKAAGYIGQAGPDTLSEATTEPYNTHVFADVLAQHLTDLGVIVQVVAWVDCEDLSCIHVPDASSTTSIVVFAGVTHNAALPQELRDLIPLLAATSPAPAITSALTSCGMGPGVDDFVAELVAAGITTIPGVALQADSGSTLTDEEMHSVLTAFAQSLVAAASA